MLLFQFPEAEELLRANDWELLREWVASHPDLDSRRRFDLTAGAELVPREPAPARRARAARARSRRSRPTRSASGARGDDYLIERGMTESGAHVAGRWRYERIEGAGHWMQLDAPDRVNALLLDFLRVKTAVELRAAFAARELSPVELLDAARSTPSWARSSR